MRTQLLVISAFAAVAAAQSSSLLPYCEDASGSVAPTGSASVHPSSSGSAALATTSKPSSSVTASATPTSAGEVVAAPHFIILTGAVLGGAWLAL
ncbi:hypothetical protein Q8F55_005999 [Vanrija albida]|uniref:Uncharacterized protein n=1 Tax=Vanrija albida TaxID=181172 RepID=A0ABR3Q351_9TREE